jgi:hypothetical protein
MMNPAESIRSEPVGRPEMIEPDVALSMNGNYGQKLALIPLFSSWKKGYYFKYPGTSKASTTLLQ